MRKLAYIFFIALFLFGCGTRNYILNVSYDPIDYPPQFFSPKDQRPVLYIDSVVDKREFAVEVTYGRSTATRKMGRFKEDSTLYFQLDDHFIPGPVNQQYRISKPPSEIIREALEKEVHRLGIKTTKDRDLAGGVLNASIEDFSQYSFKINLDLYQTGFDDPVWSGILKGKPEKAVKPWEEMFNTALSMAIKSWYNYPDFKDALVRLIGNVTSPPSPQPVVQRPSVKQQVVSGGTGFLFSTKDYIITNWHVVKGAGSILAKFTNGETVEAKVVAKDVRSDIAVLKLELRLLLYLRHKLNWVTHRRQGWERRFLPLVIRLLKLWVKNQSTPKGSSMR